MGLVINPKGTSGAGKTWLVREVMAAYRRDGAEAVPLRRKGRPRPMGWSLRHPWGRRPLAVIGHYEATRGGTDTISIADGGLDEAVRFAGALAGAGHDMLLEGLQPNGDVERTAQTGLPALKGTCVALRRGGADVEVLDAAAALHRTLALLGLDLVRRDERAGAWPNGLLPETPTPVASGPAPLTDTP